MSDEKTTRPTAWLKHAADLAATAVHRTTIEIVTTGFVVSAFSRSEPVRSAGTEVTWEQYLAAKFSPLPDAIEHVNKLVTRRLADA